MRHDVQLVVACALLATAILVPCPARADSTQVLVSHGLVSQVVGDGADLFFRDTFGGNGRTCASCHPQDNNQTIDPAFIATLPSTDPLFASSVPNLEIPELLTQFGLILENPDGTEDPTVKFVMRGVPTSLSMATSIQAPVGFPFPETTGWSGDGGLDGTLHAFSSGAVKQHFTKTLSRVPGTDFIFPTDTQLTAMEQFMRNSGRLGDLTLTSVSLAEPDAELGRRIFLNSGGDVTIGAGKCNTCHANAGADIDFGDQANHNYDAGIEDLTHPARAVHDFPGDGGLGTTLNSEGTYGDGTFNTPPLVEAADTPPFFHDNVIDNLEDAVAFFSGPEFNASPAASVVGGIDLTLVESDQVAAFLRVINAGLNASISIQRNDAAINLENSNTSTCTKNCPSSPPDGGGTTGVRQTVNTLLSLSNVEAADAIEVLNARGLNPTAVSLLQSAISKNQQAITETSSQTRKNLMRSAKADFQSAKNDLGSGLDFTLGEGNLLF